MSNSALGKTFSRGVAWFYLLKAGSRLIASIQIVIVARLLSPAEFGVMGVALLVLSLLERLATTGFDTALVQKREGVEDYLDTAWLVAAARGLALGSIVFLSAPIAAAFFQEPRAVSILRAMAWLPLINGLASPGLVQLNKNLHFKRLVLFDGSRCVLGAAVAIASALLIRSVWALVVTSVLGAVVRSAGSFLIHPYRPGLNFEWRKARDLWGFGRWILGNKLLHYLFNDGDDWVVGRLLGSQALGFYQTAYRLGNTPMTEITAVFSRVALPTFAKMQGDVTRLRLAFLRMLQVVMFASTPVAVGILLVARDAVGILMGPKWLPMVTSLQVLVLWGWIRSFRATTGPVLLARGRPDLVTKFTLFKVIVLAVLIVPLSLRWGIVGTCWAVVIAAVLEVPLLLHSLRHALQARYVELSGRIWRPLVPVLPMVLAVLLWQRLFLPRGSSVIGLVVSVVLGASSYLSLTVYLDRKLDWGLWSDIEQAAGANLRPFLDRLTALPVGKRFSAKHRTHRNRRR